MVAENTYKILQGIFLEALDSIINGLYDGSRLVFTNDFFEGTLAISFVFIGYLIAFRRIKDEEIAHKIVWTLTVFVVVYTVLYNRSWYDYLVEVLNLPMNAFLSMIKLIVSSTNNEASIENIINLIATQQDSFTSYLYEKGSITNPAPLLYGLVILLSGYFLLLVIILFGVLSFLLAKVVLALAPFVIVFLVWKKTEYIFFNWIKLYISLSLYTPFTLLFGLISINTAELGVQILNAVKDDFQTNSFYLIVLILAQLLTAMGIFKIPSIVNQIIGTSNEGSSLTGGVATVSAGAAIISTVSKYTGIRLAGKTVVSGARQAGGAVINRGSDYLKNKIQMR